MNGKGYYYDCDPMIMEIVAIGILVTIGILVMELHR